MQIYVSILTVKLQQKNGLNIFHHYLSLLTDVVSHSLPLYFFCNQNSTYYSNSLYHVGMNEGELALHKNIQQNKSFNLALNLTRGDQFVVVSQ